MSFLCVNFEHRGIKEVSFLQSWFVKVLEVADKWNYLGNKGITWENSVILDCGGCVLTPTLFLVQPSNPSTVFWKNTDKMLKIGLQYSGCNNHKSLNEDLLGLTKGRTAWRNWGRILSKLGYSNNQQQKSGIGSKTKIERKNWQHRRRCHCSSLLLVPH